MEANEIDRALEDLEGRIERLKALYEQYFMGIERLEPLVPRRDVDRRIGALRRQQIRNTAQRFKFQTLVQRYNSFQQYWTRVAREIDNGTYHRDVARAAARFGAKDTLTIFGRRQAEKYARLVANQEAKRARRSTTHVIDEDEVLGDDELLFVDDEQEFVGDEQEFVDDFEVVTDDLESMSTLSPENRESVPPPLPMAAKRAPPVPPARASVPPLLPVARASAPPPLPATRASVVPPLPAARVSAPPPLPAARGSVVPPLPARVAPPAQPSSPRADALAEPAPVLTELPGVPVEASPDKLHEAAKKRETAFPMMMVRRPNESVTVKPLEAPEVPQRSSAVPLDPSAAKRRVAELAAQVKQRKGTGETASTGPLDLDLDLGDGSRGYDVSRAKQSLDLDFDDELRSREVLRAKQSLDLDFDDKPRRPEVVQAKPIRAELVSGEVRANRDELSGRANDDKPVARTLVAQASPSDVPARDAQNAAAETAERVAANARAAREHATAARQASRGESLSDARIRQIYSEYVRAKRAANESTAGVTYDALAKQLRQQEEKLKASHPDRSVDYGVVMKNGRPTLKPILR